LLRQSPVNQLLIVGGLSFFVAPNFIMIDHTAIQAAAKAIFPTAVAWWHELNTLAEPSGAEWRTSKWIAETLTAQGIEVRQAMPEWPTLIATLRGTRGSDQVRALKCDIDALPFADGYRHACFHAGHSAIALACAHIVAQRLDQLEGTLHIIFQSAEEILPSGAEAILKAGAFQALNVQELVALHATPEYRAGTVAMRTGPTQASTDEVHIRIRATANRGNHIARPHEAMNPIAIVSTVLQELQRINTQYADPISPTLLNWAKIESNHRRDTLNVNQVPTECYVAGNFRTYDQAWRKRGHVLIQQICAGIATMHANTGLIIDVDIKPGVPPVINDDILTQNIRQIAQAYLGTAQVIQSPMRMGADDFSFYHALTGVPSCMFRLGTGPEGGGAKGLHHPDFISTVDPYCIEVGSGLLAAWALS
jgi:amidohydrolase